jgi:hypothetical protein
MPGMKCAICGEKEQIIKKSGEKNNEPTTLATVIVGTMNADTVLPARGFD